MPKRLPYCNLDPQILQLGLDLAMEFGEHLLQPIQQRLSAHFSDLAPGELDEYNRICQEAMRFGHLQVPINWRQAASEEEAIKLWTEVFHSRYPWASEENCSSLFSQGRYYAWKNRHVLGRRLVMPSALSST